MSSRLFITILALMLGPGTIYATPADADANSATAFLKQHCVQCHGAETQEAALRFDQMALANPSSSSNPSELWARMLDVMESGEMPPPDETQPSAAELKRVVDLISQHLQRTTAAIPPALRRLNRLEYENTIHDLLGIEVPLADLLPQDGSVQGFDNVADGLSISSVLMEQYLEAANVAFDAVIRRVQPLPVKTRRVQMMQVPQNVESVQKKRFFR